MAAVRHAGRVPRLGRLRHAAVLSVLLLGALAPGLAACGSDPIGGDAPSESSIDLAEQRIEYRAWRRQVLRLEADALRVGRSVRSGLRATPEGPGAVAVVRRGESQLDRIVQRLEAVRVSRGPLDGLHRRVIARLRAAVEADRQMAAVLGSRDAQAVDAAVAAARANAERLRDLEGDIARHARSLGVDPSTGSVVSRG